MVRSLELICRIIGEYLNRGVRWSDLLFRSYSVAMWRLDWKSQGEAGNSEAIAASQLSTPESSQRKWHWEEHRVSRFKGFVRRCIG